MQAERGFSVDYTHRLRFTRQARECVRELVGEARCLAFVDQGLLTAHPQLARMELPGLVEVLPVPGGESVKNDMRLFEEACRAIDRAAICRHSYVLVWGGGAVLDAVGFAAASTHRGVRLIRLPSTTLAQADSGVGVKCGLNAFGKKNLLGAFYVPHAVVCDETLLATLSDEHWRSGFSEVVKVALLRDASLFEEVERRADEVRERELEAALPLIRRSAELHLSQIVAGGDPFELGSGRPLDFGHWIAHRLEVLSDFSLTHGHAVSVGMAVDLAYGARLGVTPPALAARATSVLERLGLPLWHPRLAHPGLLQGLEDFRQHLGGKLCLPLIEELGRETTVDEVDRELLTECLAVPA